MAAAVPKIGELPAGQAKSVPSSTNPSPAPTPRRSRLLRKGRNAWHGRSPMLIGVAGRPAAGKSELVRKIVQDLAVPWIVQVSMASFYRPLTPEELELAHNENYNFDSPDAFDFEIMISVLSDLKAGRKTEIPVWDRRTFTRAAKGKTVYGAEVIFVDGVLALWSEKVRDLLDLRIFVAAEADVALAALLRSQSKLGKTPPQVIAYYNKFVKISVEEYVEPTRRFADIILPRGVENSVGLDFIRDSVESKLAAAGSLTRASLVELGNKGGTPPNLYVMPPTPQTQAMHTILRNRECTRPDFVFYSGRLTRLVMEYAASFLDFVPKEITTASGHQYKGNAWASVPCGVSVMRGGETMEIALREIILDVSIGKLLIQTDPDTLEPQLFYFRLPKDIAKRHVLLMDPLCGAGGTAMMALRVLRDHGVPEDRIIFITLLVTPMAMHALNHYFPGVRVVTSAVDEALTPEYYISPGMGNFGDRWFGTGVETQSQTPNPFVEINSSTPPVVARRNSLQSQE